MKTTLCMLLFNAAGVAAYIVANYTLRPVANEEGIGFALASLAWGLGAVATEFAIREKMRETAARLQILEGALNLKRRTERT